MTPQAHIESALAALGFADDPEMANTGVSVAQFLQEFVPGQQPPHPTVLETESQELIVVRDLPFYSLCAHHLLPFFGTATIAIRPNNRISGLGWFPKILRHHARQPQLQERLAEQLASAIDAQLSPQSVGVQLKARHMCMEMRGAEAQAAIEVLARRGQEDTDLSLALLGSEAG